MKELLKTILLEQRKTNELLMYGYQGKNPNELLTVEQVHKEFNIRNKQSTKNVQRPRIASAKIYCAIQSYKTSSRTLYKHKSRLFK